MRALQIFPIFIFLFTIHALLFAETSDIKNACPSEPLPAIEFKLGVEQPNPSDHIVKIAPSDSIYLQPSLKVDADDVGQKAALILYIYLTPLRTGFMVPVQNNITLESTQKFQNLPKTLNFSNAAGMTFDVYYGYRIGKTLKYNTYTVVISESSVAPNCAKYSDEKSCEDTNGCRAVNDLFNNFVECVLDCLQYTSKQLCNQAFDGNSCEWGDIPFYGKGCKIK